MIFYNSEKYVERCLNSILKQDLEEFEIVAINDCSTDKTLAILEKYASKDARIKIVNNEKNGGIGYARNQGIMKSVGEYIWFVDGDDFIAEGSLSKLYNYAKEKDANIVISRRIHWQNGSCFFRHLPYCENIKMDAVTASKLAFTNNGLLSAIWNRFFKRTLFLENKIFFSEGRFEDLPVYYATLFHSKNIFFNDFQAYYHVIYNDSVSHQIPSFKTMCDHFYAYGLVKEQMVKAGVEKELSEVYNHYLIKIILNWIIYSFNCDSEKYKSKKMEKDYLDITKLSKKKFSEITLNQIIFDKYLGFRKKSEGIMLKFGIYKYVLPIKPVLKKIFKRNYKN